MLHQGSRGQGLIWWESICRWQIFKCQVTSRGVWVRVLFLGNTGKNPNSCSTYHANLWNTHYLKVHSDPHRNHVQKIKQTSATTAEKPALVITLDRDYAYHKCGLWWSRHPSCEDTCCTHAMKFQQANGERTDSLKCETGTWSALREHIYKINWKMHL